MFNRYISAHALASESYAQFVLLTIETNMLPAEGDVDMMRYLMGVGM